MSEYLAVLDSSIDGKGLFTLSSRKAGEKIIDYFGEEMSLSEFKNLYGIYKLNSLHTYRMKRQNRILVAKQEPYLSKNVINYTNENINPNCVLKKRALYALHDINANEELTLLYPKDYYRSYKLY
jgi:SET domain-containing protein